LAVHDVQAQQFQPPKNSKHGGTRFGLFGFGVRGGVDFRRSGQLVLGSTLDIGDLFSNRLRLRSSAELGLFNGATTYVGCFEALWRFTDDEEVATPYIGLGFGIAGRWVWVRSAVPRSLGQHGIRFRAALPLDLQLAPRVPWHGPDAPAPPVHRTHDAPGQLAWRRRPT